MPVSKAFNIDPSATAAFSDLRAQIEANDDAQFMDEPFSAVVIGGGTGAPVSIRTLLSLGIDTNAVVAMADDGGSTGILREKANVTPPGDVRKCIAAFADDPFDPFVRAFKYRFAIANDHALGNLMLAALEDACGSFPEAITICEHFVNAQGHVYPSTLDHVTLTARTRDDRMLDGQAVACHSKTALESVTLHSSDGVIRSYPPAIRAIEDADLIVLGPGSLFTSIIPNLLVPGVVDAIRRSKGAVLFVCSLADSQGETWGLTAIEHVQALIDHGMEGLIDYVLIHSPHPLRADSPVNERFNVAVGKDRDIEADETGYPHGVHPVKINYQDMLAIQSMGPLAIVRDLVDHEHPTWHSPASLRDAFLQVVKLIQARRER